MNRLSVARAGYGAALLVAPDVFHGRPKTERLTTATRRSMRILAIRQLSEAAVCSVDTTRCLLRLEALVDVIHAGSMLGVAVLTKHPSTRRAALVNVATAAAFVGGDVVVAARIPPDQVRPVAAANSFLRLRDRVAQWFCRELAGMKSRCIGS